MTRAKSVSATFTSRAGTPGHADDQRRRQGDRLHPTAGACTAVGPSKTCIQHFKAGASATLDGQAVRRAVVPRLERRVLREEDDVRGEADDRPDRDRERSARTTPVKTATLRSRDRRAARRQDRDGLERDPPLRDDHGRNRHRPRASRRSAQVTLVAPRSPPAASDDRAVPGQARSASTSSRSGSRGGSCASAGLPRHAAGPQHRGDPRSPSRASRRPSPRRATSGRSRCTPARTRSTTAGSAPSAARGCSSTSTSSARRAGSPSARSCSARGTTRCAWPASTVTGARAR